jgi:hypothetical protein
MEHGEADEEEADVVGAAEERGEDPEEPGIIFEAGCAWVMATI